MKIFQTDWLQAGEYNSFMNAQQEILDNMEEAVLIFEENGRLKLYNKSYTELWNADETMLSGEPTFSELLDMQRSFFDNEVNWSELKKISEPFIQ